MKQEEQDAFIGQVSGGSGARGEQQFRARYPFPQGGPPPCGTTSLHLLTDAPYFTSNLLLYTMYEERVRRQPHLKHDSV
jgi:hypothetical protein